MDYHDYKTWQRIKRYKPILFYLKIALRFFIVGLFSLLIVKGCDYLNKSEKPVSKYQQQAFKVRQAEGLISAWDKGDITDDEYQERRDSLITRE